MISLTLTHWRNNMRRSASEILRNLERRVARLERKTSSRDVFHVILEEGTLIRDEGDFYTDSDTIMDNKFNSFDELLTFLKTLSRKYSWDGWIDPRVSVLKNTNRPESQNDYIESNWDDDVKVTLYINPSNDLGTSQLKAISSTLGIRHNG